MLADCGTGKQADGPVTYPGSLAYFPHLKVGEVFTDGAVQLTVKNGSSGAPVIDEVRSIDPASAFQFLGAYVASPHRKWGFNELVHGFPPTSGGFGPIRPAVGATIARGPVGTELLIGYRIVKAGYQVRESVEVDYHIGSAHYIVTVPVSVVNCPGEMRLKDCEARFDRANV